MLLDFWYPASFSDNLKRRPIRVTMMDRHLVLFRTADGSVAALNDLCVHRGGTLSDGRVIDDCVECPFHGWRYGSDGRCTHIPVLDDRPVPRRARVDAYPTRERYGIVWVHLGGKPIEELPPLPHCPEFEDPSWRANRVTTTWDAHYSRVVESDLDHTHVAFVHRRSFGALVDPRSPQPELHEDSAGWGATATVRQFGRGRSKAEFVSRLSWHLPTYTRTELATPWGTTIYYNFHLPVTAETTTTFVLRFRNTLRNRVADPVFDLLD